MICASFGNKKISANLTLEYINNWISFQEKTFVWSVLDFDKKKNSVQISNRELSGRHLGEINGVSA